MSLAIDMIGNEVLNGMELVAQRFRAIQLNTVRRCIVVQQGHRRHLNGTPRKGEPPVLIEEGGYSSLFFISIERVYMKFCEFNCLIRYCKEHSH